jgi:tRNA(Phe) wybutosine-synthesizing methylase Tyw3
MYLLSVCCTLSCVQERLSSLVDVEAWAQLVRLAKSALREHEDGATRMQAQVRMLPRLTVVVPVLRSR